MSASSSLSVLKRKREGVKEKENEEETQKDTKAADKRKKKRKIKKDRVEKKKANKDAHSGDLKAPVPTPLHVGIDRINSNWKQIQSTLKKSHTFGKFKKLRHIQTSKELDNDAAKNQDVLQHTVIKSLAPKNDNCSLTKVLAMDCEMVGAGSDGKRSILARVSMVNSWGNIVYDKHVRPMEEVTDYRTKVSGVRPGDLRKAEKFSVVQKEVADLIADRILVGHAVKHDLKVMYLSHPRKNIRDTATYLPLRDKNRRPRALRHIAAEILNVTIQDGEHCSVEDARAAMYIYNHLKQDWELTFKRGQTAHELKLENSSLQSNFCEQESQQFDCRRNM